MVPRNWEQFYLLTPALILLLPRRYLLRALTFICIASALSRLWYFYTFPENPYTPYVATPLRLDGLAIGGIIALIYRDQGKWRRVVQNKKAISILMLAMLSAAPFYAWSLRSSVGHQVLYYFGHLYLAVLYGLLTIYALLCSESGRSGLLRSKTLIFFGFISYSLYLFHTPAKGILFPIFNGSIEQLNGATDCALMLAAFVLTTGFCYCLYLGVENPCRNSAKPSPSK